MLQRAIGKWRLFKEIEPGHRFQTRYKNHRERRQRGEASSYGRIFNLVGGPALIIAGLAFLPTPGPSYIIIAIGMWMLAGEILPLARFFERLDVWLRRLGRWIKERWKTLPAPVNVLVATACAAAPGYAIYSLVQGGLPPSRRGCAGALRRRFLRGRAAPRGPGGPRPTTRRLGGWLLPGARGF